MYLANTEFNSGIAEVLTNLAHLSINASILGQMSGQIDCSFFVEALQDGNTKAQERELKNPLHGSVAGNGLIMVRNSL